MTRVTRDEAAKILAAHNRWRRSDTTDELQVSPSILGEAIDVAVAALVSPASRNDHGHPPPACGQVYRHRRRGSLHMVCRLCYGPDELLVLVNVRVGPGYEDNIGSLWDDESLFAEQDSEFEYVGLAKDVIHEASRPAPVSGQPEKKEETAEPRLKKRFWGTWANRGTWCGCTFDAVTAMRSCSGYACNPEDGCRCSFRADDGHCFARFEVAPENRA